MINLDKLEEHAKNNKLLTVSSSWMLGLIKEMRGNRARIVELEEKLRHRSMVKSDIDFPQKEFDETMGYFDRAAKSMNAMFDKVMRR